MSAIEKVGLLVILKAKAGKENEVATFLKDAVELAKKEKETLTWYSFQIDQSSFGIMDTFQTEEAREAHLGGEIAKNLMKKASILLSEAPEIQKIGILSSK